jgi:two-component system LytT family response regulator
MIRTVIIEDNDRLRLDMSNLVSRQPGFRVEGAASSVNGAIKIIQEIQPDLVLLDVSLQGGTAFDVLEKTLHLNFKIIFFTAFHEYAIKAIKAGALDYLLKPVNEIELLVALEKIPKNHYNKEQVNIAVQEFTHKSPSNKVVIRSQNYFQVVSFDEIIYCHSDNGYTTFYLTNGRKILTSKYLKEYGEQLPETIFLRPHQSYLVNTSFIDRYRLDGFLILKDNSEIPVAIRKRESVREFLNL